MKKLYIVIPVIFVLLLNFASSLFSSAFLASSSFYTGYCTTSKSFSFSTDGSLLIHSFYKTSVEIEKFPFSDRNLNLSYFSSGTWQGRPISELSSSLICDQNDTVGFSQTVSLSYDGSFFIYSVLICLPCVAGDSFTIVKASSRNSYGSTHLFTSILPGVTGIKRVYRDSNGFYTDKSVSYTLKSDNQHLICLFTSDKFSPSGANFNSSNTDLYGCDYSNISKVAANPFATMYTSNFGLTSGTDLSLHLTEGTKAWSFAVYEIFTDGKYYPGYDDGSSDDDPGGSGGSGGSVDLSKIEKYLHDILAVISGFDFHAPDPHEFWEVYKSGLSELFGLEGSEPEKPPPEGSGDSDPSGSTEDQLTFEIDEDQFNSAMDYVDVDSLDESLSGSHGAIAFFWHFTNRFFEALDLYPIVAISLLCCLATWLLRS